MNADEELIMKITMKKTILHTIISIPFITFIAATAISLFRNASQSLPKLR